MKAPAAPCVLILSIFYKCTMCAAIALGVSFAPECVMKGCVLLLESVTKWRIGRPHTTTDVCGGEKRGPRGAFVWYDDNDMA